MTKGMDGLILLCLMVIGCSFVQPETTLMVQPEQVHLSYGSEPSQMIITWVTLAEVHPSLVEYGTINLDLIAKGLEVPFVDGGNESRTLYIHRATLFNLVPGQKYIYHVGSPKGWSAIFNFKAMSTWPKWSPTFAVYGDMGNENAAALPSLQQEAERGQLDAILHVGDFAYDMYEDNARVGDAFMNQIQSVAAYIPYMVCVGNHENMYNFSNYKNRFSMPGGDGESLFYSFDIGTAHIIAFDTEFYYYYTDDWVKIVNQYKWLEKDLQEANKPKNRAQRPWIIVMGHKPMYCSNNDGPDEQCNNVDGNRVRLGVPGLKIYGLEDMFYKYGVDLQFYAHEHSYERLWPVYKKKVCNGTLSPYVNPRAPVHIITGSGGNSEGQTKFDKVPFPWHAYGSDDFGYTRLKLTNSTHLYLEQVSVDKGGNIIDKMWLIKDRHGTNVYDCHL